MIMVKDKNNIGIKISKEALISILLAGCFIMLAIADNSFADLDMNRLLLYWNCEAGEGNVLMDISGNGRDAMIKAGKSEWWLGKFGGGIRLKQAYAQVDGNIIESIGDTGQISLMFWFKINQHSGYDGLISIKPPKGNCCSYRLMVDPNFNPFWSAGHPVDKILPSFTFDLNRWYHYALTADEKSSKIYVDSIFIVEQAENLKLPVFKEVTVYLGTGENPGMHSVEDTIFDEVMIWDKVLSENEIRETWENQSATLVKLMDKVATTWGIIKVKH